MRTCVVKEAMGCVCEIDVRNPKLHIKVRYVMRDLFPYVCIYFICTPNSTFMNYSSR